MIPERFGSFIKKNVTQLEIKISLENLTSKFKGSTKLYFMHYSCVVIILLNTSLDKFAFSTYYMEN